MASKLAPGTRGKPPSVRGEPFDSMGGLKRGILLRALELRLMFHPRWLRLRPHIARIALLFLVALWMMRHFLSSSAIPAGSDMFGFVARTKAYSGWDNMASAWAPSFYGAPQQYTLDLVLGFVNQLVGDPLVTVKLLAFGSLFGAGTFTYLLSYRWYRIPWAAMVAGLLYMTSQQSLSRWGTGQLNHEMGFALAPLLVYLLAKCIDGFSTPRAIAFALALNAELLIRPDVVLWIAPFLVLYPIVHAAVCRRERATASTLVRMGVVVLPATIALNMMQILPLLAGVRAAWVSTGGLYGYQDLLGRSLGAYPSLLGFGREIGYIGFTGQQTSSFHPWVPNWIYFGSATVVVTLAYAALWQHRDHRTIFLAASAITGTFLAKSVKGPIGGPYQWAVQHVPLVPNLRDPNRWLIIQALAYALLASLTLWSGFQWLHALAKRSGNRRGRLLRASFVVGFALILLPVGPTLVSGLRTWRPEPGQLALLKAIASDGAPFTVATVPYDQTGRFLVQSVPYGEAGHLFAQGNYEGWEHDLGSDSAPFTGHPAIADGGWNQRSQDFVAFTTGLLRNHDPAFQEILGATGTKYLVRFAYAPSQPHLVRGGIPPYWQQAAIDSIPGFLPIATNAQGTIYRLSSWSPLASIRPNLAVILGGPSGVAALADLPGIHLQDWAVVTASDALSAGGLPQLLELLNESKMVVVSNETVTDFGVLASDPLAQIPGITSDPGFDRVGQQLGSDASSRQGSLADASAPVAATRTFSAGGSFTLDHARELELWTRIKSFPNAARVSFSVDGRTVGSLTPVSPFQGGLRWIGVYRGVFDAGTHQVTIRVSNSQFGGAFELDESRVIDPAQRLSAQSQIEAVLNNEAEKVSYAFDLQDIQKWNDSFDPFVASVPVGKANPLSGGSASASHASTAFWRVLNASHVEASSVGSSSNGMVDLRATPDRRYFALVEHEFPTSQDWLRKPFIFLTIDGTASGQAYQFVINFDGGQAHWDFVDDKKGLRTLAFSPSVARSTAPIDWSSIEGVKVATAKSPRVSIGIGGVRISGSGTLPLVIPILPTGELRTATLQDVGSPGRVAGERIGIGIQPHTTSVSIDVPFGDLQDGVRLVIPPEGPVHELPAVPVTAERIGIATFGFRKEAAGAGVLVFNQGFDPGWVAQGEGAKLSPIPVFSVMNGFFLEPKAASSLMQWPLQGSITYSGQRAASIGLGLSAVSWVALAALGIGLMLLRKRKRMASGLWRKGGWQRLAGVSASVAIVLVAGAVGIAGARSWGKRSEQQVSFRWPQGVGSDPSTFWRSPDGNHVRLDRADGPDSGPALEVKVKGERPFFTILEHTFASANDWFSGEDIFLYYRGGGTGMRYRFNIYTDERYKDSLGYSFVDNQRGWQVLRFNLHEPEEVLGKPNLGHVVALRLSADQRELTGALSLGSMAISRPDEP